MCRKKSTKERVHLFLKNNVLIFFSRSPQQNEIYESEFLSKGPALENLKEDYAKSNSLLQILEEQNSHLEVNLKIKRW